MVILNQKMEISLVFKLPNNRSLRKIWIAKINTRTLPNEDIVKQISIKLEQKTRRCQTTAY